MAKNEIRVKCHTLKGRVCVPLIMSLLFGEDWKERMARLGIKMTIER